MREVLWLALGVVLILFALVVRFAVRGNRHIEAPGQRSVYETLRTANLLAPPLRAGFSAESLSRILPQLRNLLATRGVLVADQGGVLASEGVDAEHQHLLQRTLEAVMASGRPAILPPGELSCSRASGCPLSEGAAAPLHIGGAVVGVLAALDQASSPGLLRLCGEVACFMSTQLELAELDRSKERAARAELRFLRAQISPHFVYNALTAIESFIRSDPERARQLVVAFAEFTRYSFATHSQFITLAEELRLVDTYLDLERARFGDRLQVTLRVAPEALNVKVPSLVLQPIVENAVRHGLEPSERGHLSIDIADQDSEALICVEDDGVGSDPVHLRRILSGSAGTDSVGLHNVDERLRATFGDEYGLVVETAKGAGTKVNMRVPKFHSATRSLAGRQ